MIERESPLPYEPLLSPPDTTNYTSYTIGIDRKKEGIVSTIQVLGIDPDAEYSDPYPLFRDIERPQESLLVVSGDTVVVARDALDTDVEPVILLQKSGQEAFYAYMHMRRGGRVESWDMTEAEQFDVLDHLGDLLTTSMKKRSLDEREIVLNRELDRVRYEHAINQIAYWSRHTEHVMVTCTRDEAEEFRAPLTASLAGFTDLVREVYEMK